MCSSYSIAGIYSLGNETQVTIMMLTLPLSLIDVCCILENHFTDSFVEGVLDSWLYIAVVFVSFSPVGKNFRIFTA